MADFEKLGAFYIGRGYDAAKDSLAAEPLMYDSRDLTTHAVCVGIAWEPWRAGQDGFPQPASTL